MEPPLDPPSKDWDEREEEIKAIEEEAYRRAEWARYEAAFDDYRRADWARRQEEADADI